MSEFGVCLIESTVGLFAEDAWKVVKMAASGNFHEIAAVATCEVEHGDRCNATPACRKATEFKKQPAQLVALLQQQQ